MPEAGVRLMKGMKSGKSFGRNHIRVETNNKPERYFLLPSHYFPPLRLNLRKITLEERSMERCCE
jgi:hypothetical protein